MEVDFNIEGTRECDLEESQFIMCLSHRQHLQAPFWCSLSEGPKMAGFPVGNVNLFGGLVGAAPTFGTHPVDGAEVCCALARVPRDPSPSMESLSPRCLHRPLPQYAIFTS